MTPREASRAVPTQLMSPASAVGASALRVRGGAQHTQYEPHVAAGRPPQDQGVLRVLRHIPTYACPNTWPDRKLRRAWRMGGGTSGPFAGAVVVWAVVVDPYGVAHAVSKTLVTQHGVYLDELASGGGQRKALARWALLITLRHSVAAACVAAEEQLRLRVHQQEAPAAFGYYTADPNGSPLHGLGMATWTAPTDERHPLHGLQPGPGACFLHASCAHVARVLDQHIGHIAIPSGWRVLLETTAGAGATPAVRQRVREHVLPPPQALPAQGGPWRAVELAPVDYPALQAQLQLTRIDEWLSTTGEWVPTFLVADSAIMRRARAPHPGLGVYSLRRRRGPRGPWKGDTLGHYGGRVLAAAATAAAAMAAVDASDRRDKDCLLAVQPPGAGGQWLVVDGACDQALPHLFRANDCRNTAFAPRARMLPSGEMVLLMDMPALDWTLPLHLQPSAEITWEYGEQYWATHEAAGRHEAPAHELPGDGSSRDGGGTGERSGRDRAQVQALVVRARAAARTRRAAVVAQRRMAEHPGCATCAASEANGPSPKPDVGSTDVRVRLAALARAKRAAKLERDGSRAESHTAASAKTADEPLTAPLGPASGGGGLSGVASPGERMAAAARAKRASVLARRASALSRPAHPADTGGAAQAVPEGGDAARRRSLRNTRLLNSARRKLAYHGRLVSAAGAQRRGQVFVEALSLARPRHLTDGEVYALLVDVQAAVPQSAADRRALLLRVLCRGSMDSDSDGEASSRGAAPATQAGLLSSGVRRGGREAGSQHPGADILRKILRAAVGNAVSGAAASSESALFWNVAGMPCGDVDAMVHERKEQVLRKYDVMETALAVDDPPTYISLQEVGGSTTAFHEARGLRQWLGCWGYDAVLLPGSSSAAGRRRKRVDGAARQPGIVLAWRRAEVTPTRPPTADAAGVVLSAQFRHVLQPRHAAATEVGAVYGRHTHGGKRALVREVARRAHLRRGGLYVGDWNVVPHAE